MCRLLRPREDSCSRAMWAPVPLRGLRTAALRKQRIGPIALPGLPDGGGDGDVERRLGERLALEQLERARDVLKVREDRGRVEALLAVLLHHERDRRLREEVLQLVVGVVDEELLEAVDSEHLGAEDVEQSDEELAAVTCGVGSR